MTSKLCSRCSAPFAPVRSTKTFCSQACQKLEWQAKRRRKDRENNRRRIVYDLRSRWQKAEDAVRSAQALLTDTLSEYEEGHLDVATRDRRLQKPRRAKEVALSAKRRIEAEADKAGLSL